MARKSIPANCLVKKVNRAVHHLYELITRFVVLGLRPDVVSPTWGKSSFSGIPVAFEILIRLLGPGVFPHKALLSKDSDTLACKAKSAKPSLPLSLIYCFRSSLLIVLMIRICIKRCILASTFSVTRCFFYKKYRVL